MQTWSHNKLGSEGISFQIHIPPMDNFTDFGFTYFSPSHMPIFTYFNFKQLFYTSINFHDVYCNNRSYRQCIHGRSYFSTDNNVSSFYTTVPYAVEHTWAPKSIFFFFGWEEGRWTFFLVLSSTIYDDARITKCPLNLNKLFTLKFISHPLCGGWRINSIKCLYRGELSNGTATPNNLQVFQRGVEFHPEQPDWYQVSHSFHTMLSCNVNI